MKLAQFLSVGTIADALESGDREGVLRELADLLAAAGVLREDAGLARILMNREELGSTGIGEGVAIPHVRINGLPRLSLSVGRSRGGVDFKAIDGRPVHLFFLLLAPDDSTGDHLKALASISRLIKKPAVKEALLAAGSREEIREIIAREDETN